MIEAASLAPGLTRDFRFSPEPLMVLADREQLRQVLANLVKNAREAMGGTGTLAIEGSVEGGMVRLVVADTGPGVAPQHRAELFQPLFTTKAKGSGLGLWSCRQLVERHGGTIQLLDDRGPGAAFLVALPQGAPPVT
jgi:two-component system sensor kinase FixL